MCFRGFVNYLIYLNNLVGNIMSVKRQVTYLGLTFF